ncbi:hypothetical protein KQY27_02420 [Methanobrevibacter sp. TMH8]|uniref:hypothetical protein n=1 Tax=Methanobrevibacter sp. TMH8 TaxID=2848611 RepID=UPI001CCB4BD9|nr:hypothetical protein [Methanobrevibacter sp. TMH8]MBZ9570398.1 hypothetical protein [Methanobrevibacter sp. TMH8]
MKDDYGVQEEILFSLFRTRHIGKKHTPINNVCKRLTKFPCKQIRHDIKSLMKQGLILPYPTGHDPDVRLNPKKMNEIKEIIRLKILTIEKNFG